MNQTAASPKIVIFDPPPSDGPSTRPRKNDGAVISLSLSDISPSEESTRLLESIIVL